MLLTFLFPHLYSAGGTQNSHCAEWLLEGDLLLERRGLGMMKLAQIWVWKKKSVRFKSQRVLNKEKELVQNKVIRLGSLSLQPPSEIQWKILSPAVTLWCGGTQGQKRFSETPEILFPLPLVQSHQQYRLDLSMVSLSGELHHLLIKSFTLWHVLLSFYCGFWMFNVLLGAFSRICFHSICGAIILWTKLMGFNYAKAVDPGAADKFIMCFKIARMESTDQRFNLEQCLENNFLCRDAAYHFYFWSWRIWLTRGIHICMVQERKGLLLNLGDSDCRRGFSLDFLFGFEQIFLY